MHIFRSLENHIFSLPQRKRVYFNFDYSDYKKLRRVVINFFFQNLKLTFFYFVFKMNFSILKKKDLFNFYFIQTKNWLAN